MTSFHPGDSAEPDLYSVSLAPARPQLATIDGHLARSCWSECIPMEVVAQAVANSLHARFGFTLWRDPERFMELHRPGINGR